MTGPEGGISGRETAFMLSVLTAIAAAVQAAAGILFPGTYRDNVWVASTWHGTDVVTLGIAVPLLLIAIYYTQRGSLRGGLLRIGMLYYVLYNNMYYLFGMAYNGFFLVYPIIFVVSAGALFSALATIDAGRIAAQFGPGGWMKWIAAWMFVLTAILLANALGEYIPFVREGTVPQILADTGLHTSLVATCDLTLWVPLLVLGGAWLLRSRPWGYILSAQILISAGIYCIGLAAATWYQDLAGIPGVMASMPLWIVLAAASLVSSVALLSATAPWEAAPR